MPWSICSVRLTFCWFAFLQFFFWFCLLSMMWLGVPCAAFLQQIFFAFCMNNVWFAFDMFDYKYYIPWTRYKIYMHIAIIIIYITPIFLCFVSLFSFLYNQFRICNILCVFFYSKRKLGVQCSLCAAKLHSASVCVPSQVSRSLLRTSK